MKKYNAQSKADWEDAKQSWGCRSSAGRPKGSGTGRTVETSSINLPPTLWEKLDQIRGDQTRSAWIADRIKKARG